MLQVIYAARDGQEPMVAMGDSSTADRDAQRTAENGTGRVQTALAKVNAVAPGSPASQAVRLLQSGHYLCSPLARREWKRTTSSFNSGSWTGATRWRMLERW